MNAQQLLYRKLISKVLLLSLDDRLFVLQRLHDSLEVESEEDVEQSWREEIRRRIDEIDSGKVKCRAGHEVMEESRARFNT